MASPAAILRELKVLAASFAPGDGSSSGINDLTKIAREIASMQPTKLNLAAAMRRMRMGCTEMPTPDDIRAAIVGVTLGEMSEMASLVELWCRIGQGS